MNDKYGHLHGDEVLKQIACVIRDIVRDSDVAARYGGEEFVVLLPNTDAKGALTLVKRINSSIIKLKTGGTKAEQVTVSVGLATCKGDKNAPFDQIIQEAEQAMKRQRQEERIKLLFTTTCERKNDFLLIEVFRKLFNSQNYGHQGSILGGHLLFVRSVRISHFSQAEHPKAM